MEHIDGETLGEQIASGSLSISDALPLFIDIAHGLPPRQMTFDQRVSYSLFWLDGDEQYVYSSSTGDGTGYTMYRRNADGLGTAQEVTRTTGDQWYVSASSTTQDQSTLLGTEILTGIFIGFRAGVAALLISVATLVGAAWAYLTGRLPANPPPKHLLLTRPELASDFLTWVLMG